MPKTWLDKDINDCIMNADPECDLSPEGSVYMENMVTYFCGNAIECRQYGNKEALQVIL